MEIWVNNHVFSQTRSLDIGGQAACMSLHYLPVHMSYRSKIYKFYNQKAKVVTDFLEFHPLCSASYLLAVPHKITEV